MLKVMIIENKHDSEQLLQSLLTEYCPQVNVITLANDYIESMDSLCNEDPDLVFYDVNHSASITYNDLQSKMNDTCKTVLTSTYDMFALEPYRELGIDYLLKPYKPINVIQAVNRIEKNH